MNDDDYDLNLCAGAAPGLAADPRQPGVLPLHRDLRHPEAGGARLQDSRLRHRRAG